jgi:hypothetical protein
MGLINPKTVEEAPLSALVVVSSDPSPRPTSTASDSPLRVIGLPDGPVVRDPEEPGSSPGGLTWVQKDHYLALLKSGAGVMLAASRIESDDRSVLAERRRDREFDIQVKSAREIAKDVCLLRLYRRAIADTFDLEAAVAFVSGRERAANGRLARQLRRIDHRVRVAERRLRMRLLGRSLPPDGRSDDGVGGLDRDELEAFAVVLQAALTGQVVSPEQEVLIGRLCVRMWRHEVREETGPAGRIPKTESADVSPPGGAGPRGPRTA